MSEPDFIYGGKHNDTIYYFFDIDGNETSNASNVVAREIIGDKTMYSIRLTGNSPVHHSIFKSSPVLNPTFANVDKETFKNYIEYLLTKKEGSYKLTHSSMKAKGII